MPFVTEEIWQRFAIGDSISIAAWPEANAEHVDMTAEASFAGVQEIVTEIRQFRSTHGISPRLSVEASVGVPDHVRSAIADLEEPIGRLAGLSTLTTVDRDGGKRLGWTTLALTDGFVNLPPGLYDTRAERERVSKRRNEVDTQLRRSEAKLANDGFRSKASPDVVEQEEAKHERLRTQLAELESRLVELDG
jgi:valyl-tRNA synthetase